MACSGLKADGAASCVRPQGTPSSWPGWPPGPRCKVESHVLPEQVTTVL